MLEELRSLYEDSGTWGQLILAAELGLIIAGIIMLYTVKQAIRFLMFLLVALLPILLGFFGYLQFSSDVSDLVQQGMESDVLEQAEEAVYKPVILGAMAVVVPLILGFLGLRRVRRLSRSSVPAQGVVHS